MLSLRANLDVSRAAGLTASYAPDATLVGPLDALADLVYDGRDLHDAVRQGPVSVSGDEALVRRFLTLFTFPDKVALPTD